MDILENPEVMEALQGIFMEQMQREKALKVERFRRLNPLAKKGQIVFAGSSLMEQFPIHELLMDLGLPYTVYNRGVGGFTTAEMAQVLDECIFQLEPSHIFLNIGTNDFNTPDQNLDEIMGRYEGILRAIRERLPQAKITLLAYYPVNEEVGRRNPMMASVFEYRTNARIREANAAVECLAEKMGAAFLDLNESITDEQGRLKEEYTVEGMHLYGDGYYQVLQALLPALKEATRGL